MNARLALLILCACLVALTFIVCGILSDIYSDYRQRVDHRQTFARWIHDITARPRR